jgi:mono/diheme cytochrome c family protein
VAGAVLYHAGSCFACHRPPDGAAEAALPSGGRPFPTPVGVFYPQNLTPDAETGLGRWSADDFVHAMTRGAAPDGSHYFPAFPYVSYRAMTASDLADLWAYLKGLKAVHAPNRPHEVRLLALARRGVGLWKRLAFRRPPFAVPQEGGASWRRGAYLANGPGHCGECHTPKDALLLEDASRHFAGGPHPGGEGSVPSLRGLRARGRYESPAALTLALQNGEELGFENLSSGGMGQIQENLARLPEDDLRALSEYLLSLE